MEVWVVVELWLVALVGMVADVEPALVVEADAESDITETALEPVSATNTSPLPESYAAPLGSVSTVTFATTLLLVSEMTGMAVETPPATNISPFPGRKRSLGARYPGLG